MTDKEQIFDYVVELEDKLLENVRVEVKKSCLEKFGDLGVKVAEKYYNQIDGVEPIGDDDFQENCDDCAEKAKRLLANLDFLKMCNESLTSDVVDKLYDGLQTSVELSKQGDSNVEILCDDHVNKSLFDVDKRTRDLLCIRVFLEMARKHAENDNQPS